MNRPAACLILLAALAPVFGWQRSFQAGGTDSNGQFMGGIETMNLTAHKGKLFAGISYWTESDSQSMHESQVLVLDKPDGAWKQDLALAMSLRTQFVASFVFTRDCTGAAISPDTLLVAVGTGEACVYVRNDGTGTWTKSPIPALNGLTATTRSLGVHTDPVAGRQMLIAGVNIGVNVYLFSAQYDAAAPGRLRWTDTPEMQENRDLRVMAFCEADGSLYETSSQDSIAELWRRTDGASPGWELVWSNNAHAPLNCNMRGITPVPDPLHPGRQDILFFWADRIVRVEPGNGFHDTTELTISRFVNQAAHMNARGSLAAYNDIPRFYDPALADSMWLIGTQMTGGGIPERRRGIFLKRTQHDAAISYYADSVADSAGTQVFEAVRCFCVSPFAQDQGRVLYAGGYDGDNRPNHLTAWIWRGDFTARAHTVPRPGMHAVAGPPGRMVAIQSPARRWPAGALVDIRGRTFGYAGAPAMPGLMIMASPHARTRNGPSHE